MIFFQWTIMTYDLKLLVVFTFHSFNVSNCINMATSKITKIKNKDIVEICWKIDLTQVLSSVKQKNMILLQQLKLDGFLSIITWTWFDRN